MKIFVQNFKIGVQSLIYESLPLRVPGRENLCFKILLTFLSDFYIN